LKYEKKNFHFSIYIFKSYPHLCAEKDDSSSSSSSDDSSSGSSSTDNSYSGSSVTLNISSFVIDTTLAAGTITGGVLSQDNDSDLSGVSVSFEKSGTTVDTTTTDSSGDFSQTLILGTYTITYSKIGYLDETQSVTLATDNQTLVASTLKMLPDNCTSGTISGTIKDAVNNNPVTGVSLSVRRGVNVTSGTSVDSTSDTGTYSLSSMSAGWYTVETRKSGYYLSTFNVYACGDNSGNITQNTSISTTLASGAMRIVLTWKTATDDLDSHLTGPDNLSGQGHSNAVNEQFHLYYDNSTIFYYAINNFHSSDYPLCSGCSASQKSDNVTLDLDNFYGIGTCDECGPETITISAVRSGTYRYYVHNYQGRIYDQAGFNNLKLAASEASVKVYYNDTVTTFNVPNIAADLWYVFEFDNSSGLTAVNNMGSDSLFTKDVFAPTISEVTAVTTPTNDNTSLSYSFSSTDAGTITYGGSCSSSTTSATAGNNIITFEVLAEGPYSNCKISVDNNSNTSDNLSVSSFRIDTTAPTLLDNLTIASNNTLYTTMAKTGDNITLSITSSEAIQTPTVTIAGRNATVTGSDNITWSATYKMVEDRDEGSVSLNIGFIDLAGNPGDNVTSTSNGSAVEFDKTSPVLQPVDNVTTPTSDNTSLSYTFSSTEAGTINYSVCSGSLDNASADNNTITFDALADDNYSTGYCKISVTDNASNTSDNLSVSSFTIDTVKPVLARVTDVTTPTNDTTPEYSFSSTEAGTNSYGGNCGSSSTSATSSGLDNVTIILTQPDNSTALSEGLYETVPSLLPTLRGIPALH